MSLYPRRKGTAMRPVTIGDEDEERPPPPPTLPEQEPGHAGQPEGQVAGGSSWISRDPTAQNRSFPRKKSKRRRQMRSPSSSSSSCWSSPSPKTPKRKPIPRKAKDCWTSSSSSSDVNSFNESSSYLNSEGNGDDSELDLFPVLIRPVENPTIPTTSGENPGAGAEVDVEEGDVEALSSVPEPRPGPSEPRQSPSGGSFPPGESFQIPVTGNERIESILESGTGWGHVVAAPEVSDSDTDPFPTIIQAQVHQNGFGDCSLNPVMVTALEQQEAIIRVSLPSPSHSHSVSAAPSTPTASRRGRGPTIIDFPLPPICFTEADRVNRKYVDLLIRTYSAEANPEGVTGGDIFGHRIVLEKIPFLQPKLGHSPGEIDIIEVPELNPIAVETIVSMYYTHELILTRDCPLDEIFTVIEKFEIKERNINCWTVRGTAVGRNDHRLVGRVDRYILNNFENAINYEEFLHVEYNQMSHYISEAVQLVSSPQDVLLSAIVRWAGYATHRTELIFDLINLLDLGVIFEECPERLRQVFGSGSILASIPSCMELHNRVVAAKAYELLNAVGEKGNGRIKKEPAAATEKGRKGGPTRIKTEPIDNDQNFRQLPEILIPPPAPFPPSESELVDVDAQDSFEDLPGLMEMLGEVPPLSLYRDTTNTNPPPAPQEAPQDLNQVLLYPVIESNGHGYLGAFDFRGNTSHRLHEVARPRHLSCLLQLENYIYEMGGAKGPRPASIWDNMNSTTTVDIFTKGITTSVKGASLAQKRRVCTANYINGSIYIIGGDSNDKNQTAFVSNMVEKLNRSKTAFDRWETASFLISPRSCHASAFLLDRLYVAGGIGCAPASCMENDKPEYSALKSVEVFNPMGGEEEEWEEVAQMNVGRRCFRLHVKGNKMYAIGGENCSGVGLLNSVEVYDPGEDNWRFVASMNHGRANFGILELNGRIYVVGGNSEDNRKLSVEAYDPDEDTWTLVPWPKGLCRRASFISSTPISSDYLSS